MSFTFRPAERADSKVLLGLYGLSGTGKTMSSLLVARGLVGPKGRVAMIDTESGRGGRYADVIPGGYDRTDLGEPFSPQRYIEAIAAAEKAGYGALVIDSLSHAWEGIGGVLAMAGDNEARTGKPGLHCWKEPKLQHQRMLLKLLQTDMHIILTLRAKHKSRQVRNPQTGKQEIVKDDEATPIQEEGFIYELSEHAEVLADHTIRLTKNSHPEIGKCFPRGRPLSVETGEALAEWARGGAAKAEDGKREEPRDPKAIADWLLKRIDAATDARSLEVTLAGQKAAAALEWLRVEHADQHAAVMARASARKTDLQAAA